MLMTKRGVVSGVTSRDIGVTSNLWFYRNNCQMGSHSPPKAQGSDLAISVREVLGAEGRDAAHELIS